VLTPADVLNERYRLDAPIASGGMGEVWRATDINLGRTVALKVMRAERLSNTEFDARFRAEARTMAALHHPNVVNIYDYGRSPLADGTSVSYLVMTYVDGESLRDRLAATGPLPVAETMALLAQAADALHAVHRHGIVHRDVKPANLLVQADGTVTLVDFGVARSDALTSVTTANAILGTALYMAPEQASGRTVSAATDIYALGAVAFHCLAGTPPFNGETALEIALRHVSDEPPPLPEDTPAAACALVTRALAKDPADRFTSAAAFAAAARSAAADPDAVPADAGAPATTLVAAGPKAGRPLPSPRSVRAGKPSAAGATPDGQATALPAAQSGGSAPSRPARRRVAALAGAAVVVLAGLAGLSVLLNNNQSAPAAPPHQQTVSPSAVVPGALAPTPAGGTPTRPTNVDWSTPPSGGAPSSAAPSHSAPPTRPASPTPTAAAPPDQPSSAPPSNPETPTGPASPAGGQP
jgi:serine/threonine-protein kinase